jgi:hypothetical protein
MHARLHSTPEEEAQGLRLDQAYRHAGRVILRALSKGSLLGP